MEPSGPISLEVLEADLAMSDDDAVSQENWPPLLPGSSAGLVAGAVAASGLSTPSAQHLTTQAPSTAKRRITSASDNNSEPSSPVAKSSKRRESSGPQQRAPSPDCGTSRPAHHLDPSLKTPSLSAPPPLAFAPRTDYIKLLFRDNPTVDIKLRWLSEVTRAFHLDRDQAEVKMSAITSRYVYISRRRSDIVDSVTRGEFLSCSLEVQDSPERPRKFPTYLLTRYPVCSDPALAKEMPGIYTARRFHQNGTPINRLVVTWSLPQPPPPSVAFSFLPCLPSCEFRRMKDEQPWCYRCWSTGHISRYCSASERCAYCSESHDSRTCPHRPAPPPAPASDSSSMQPQPLAPDTSLWKCPRCHQPGVNVWHPGCPRRRVHAAPAATHTTTRASQSPPPPPRRATPPATTTNLESTQVTALRAAVAALQNRVTSLTARFEAIETRLDGLVSKQDTFETQMKTVVESQQVIIASITSLTEQLSTVASSLETLTTSSMGTPPRGVQPSHARVTTASPTSRRSPRGKVQ